jgi:SAM-dependent methyltransferase
VSGLWHPVSAVYLGEPRVLASPAILRLLLAGEGRAQLVYAGDRMWPAIRHGDALVVSPLAASTPAHGDVVLANEGGIPDVVRWADRGGEPAVAADADPGPPRRVAPHEVLGRVEPAPRRSWLGRSIVRACLDLREAAGRGPDPVTDPAQTVREKYEEQAVHYDRSHADALSPRLSALITRRVPPGSRILVAGSGAGREAFELERLGYRVIGLDFSPRMVAAATAEAARRVSSATFSEADLRTHDEADGSLGAVVFTYEVYSFVPGGRDRTALLTRLRRWLVPGGVLLLSARRTRQLWDNALLTLQWLARVARLRPGAWGDSHTRWLDAAGNFRRSFIHVFTDARLDREAAAAGFSRESWEGGHGLFVPREPSSRPGRA